ncbi:MAG: L,D-transpeptidase [Methylovulum sp.]|nr:L,D-transpeptidase [Methylovulum sp.]
MVTESFLDISIRDQTLKVIERGLAMQCYLVSTAKNGAGELMGSGCTPRGWHKIKAKIGASQPSHAVFVGRRPTGEVYSPALAGGHPHRDWILTRILWLVGLEPGKNRYGNVDTGWRYIYIHGGPDELMDGKPGSHGCIRMANADVLDLFNRVDAGIKVFIHE